MMGLSESFTEALGLTLLDSLWQGAIILLLCTLLLALFKSGAARWRYRLVLLGLLALPVAAIFTFNYHYEPAASVANEPLSWPKAIETEIEPFQIEQAAEAPGMIERWQMWAQQNANWVVMAWAIGLMIFAFRMAGGFYMIRSLRSSAKPMEQPHWQIRLAELGASLGLKISVQIKESARVNSPIVVGYLKPLIIFPLGLIQGISTDQVEAILLHELAHIKRHDYLVNLLVSLLQVIYFYHPAYWWLQQQLDAEREYSCDDLVLRHVNQLSLVKALTAVKEFQINQYAPVLGFAGHKNQLLKRVERIMKKKTRTNWLGGLLSMTALLLSFFLMSYRTASPLEEVEMSPELAEIDTPFQLQTVDSLTVQQAVMQLLDPKNNKIILELDGRGRLVDMMRNGEPIGQAELKIFQEAHARLSEYRYREEKLSVEQLEEERRKLTEELKLIEERYLQEKSTLKEVIVEEYQNVEESEALRKRLKEYLELYDQLKRSASEHGEAYNKVELEKALKAYELMMAELLKTDSVSSRAYGNLSKAEYLEFISRTRELAERHRSEEESLLRLTEELISKGKLEKSRKIFDNWVISTKEQTSIDGTTFEFYDNAAGEAEAIKFMTEAEMQIKKALVVVDGEVKESWKVQDINKIDRSRKIRKIDIVRSEKVDDSKLKPHMAGRDYLFAVTTADGGKKYKRPNIRIDGFKEDKQLDAEKKEVFSKRMKERLSQDGHLSEGWSNLELSTEALLINGKKQPKKLLKSYLKLYQEIMGKKLDKGQVLELKE